MCNEALEKNAGNIDPIRRILGLNNFMSIFLTCIDVNTYHL